MWPHEGTIYVPDVFLLGTLPAAGTLPRLVEGCDVGGMETLPAAVRELDAHLDAGKAAGAAEGVGVGVGTARVVVALHVPDLCGPVPFADGPTHMSHPEAVLGVDGEGDSSDAPCAPHLETEPVGLVLPDAPCHEPP